MNTLRRFYAWLYMTEAQAHADGFTHHGRMFGCPIWTTDANNFWDTPMIAAKFAPCEMWITFCSLNVQMISMFADVGFPITICKRISDDIRRVQ